MKKLFIFLKGILLGFVGLAVPGLSASTVAVEVGIYYELIDKISNVLKKFKQSIAFLVFICLGYFAGGLIGAFSVDILYKNFPLITALLIIGFILGGLPNMATDLKGGVKKVSCYICFFVTVILLLAFSFFVKPAEQTSLSDMAVYDFIILFFVGMITSSTLIIPGVDFAVLLLSMGYYNSLIGVMSDLVRFQNVLYDIAVLGTYLIGYGIGSFLLSKLIKKLIDRFFIESQFISFAFVVVAPFIVVKNAIVENPNFAFNYVELIIGIILGIAACVGMFFTMRYLRRKKELKNDKCLDSI